jgi:hypothetical protein
MWFYGNKRIHFVHSQKIIFYKLQHFSRYSINRAANRLFMRKRKDGLKIEKKIVKAKVLMSENRERKNEIIQGFLCNVVFP